MSYDNNYSDYYKRYPRGRGGNYGAKPKTPYVPNVQYIVEYRPNKGGELYLFTQKEVRPSERQGPVTLKNGDCGWALSESELQERDPDMSVTVRPVVVGTIDPDTGIIIYYADQD